MHHRLMTCSLVTAALWVSGSAQPAHAFAYIFAGEGNGVDIVTHPTGYTGSGGVLTVTVGIDPTSANAAQMEIPTQNVIRTFNNLMATTGNLGSANVPAGAADFESVLLHELGHSLGLAHNNLASESGVAGNDRDYTKSTNGANNMFDLNPGLDGVVGTSDDIRGDDVNLNYFAKATNNPFELESTVDTTTYSRDLADLPGTDTYSATGSRQVAGTLAGVPDNTEAVMNQGSFFGEAQRTLAADDVAGILYAAAGLDGIAGTADDYVLNLVYAGLTTDADIVIDFDNSQTGFAVSQSSGTFLNPTHVAITDSNIYFNTDHNWFFNQEPNVEVVPEPSSLAMMALAGAVGAGLRRRQRRRNGCVATTA